MSQKRPQDSLTYKILDALWNAAVLLPEPLESPYQWKQRIDKFDPNQRSSYFAFRRLKQQKLIRIVQKHEGKFIELTKQGKLEILFQKGRLCQPQKWDKKWRVVIFDIPERSRKARGQFRRLLVSNNFVKLQNSVFISPYTLNNEAVEYLNISGLKDYIRIMRVDKMDNENELIKQFGL